MLNLKWTEKIQCLNAFEFNKVKWCRRSMKKMLISNERKTHFCKINKTVSFFQFFWVSLIFGLDSPWKTGIYGPSIQKHYQLIIFIKNFHVGFTEFMSVFIQIWTRGFGLIRSSLISRSVTWLTVIFRFLWVILWGLSEKKVWKNFWIFYKFSDLSRFPANVS